MIKRFANTIKFIVVDKDNAGRSIDPTSTKRALSSSLSRVTGGIRVALSTGIFISASGTEIREGNAELIVSFEDKLWPLIVPIVAEFGALGAAELRQEKLAIEVNGILYLIDTASSANDCQ